MKPVWILVADSNKARLFTAESSASDLIEIETMSQLEAQLNLSTEEVSMLREQVEVIDKPHDEQHFAKRVIKRLSNALNHNKFERLFIVAAPSFLGTLRNACSQQLEKTVSFSLGKNIVNLKPVQIRAHLPHSLT